MIETMTDEEHLIRRINLIRVQCKRLKRELRVYNSNNEIFDNGSLGHAINLLAITQYKTRYLFDVLRTEMRSNGFACDKAWKENLLKPEVDKNVKVLSEL